MRALVFLSILILSQLIWMGFTKSRHNEEGAPDGRDLRFTLQTIKCFDPLGYGDDDVRIDVKIPGRELVTFKKTMAHKGPTKLWDINEPFYFSEDSVVVLKLWIQGPKDKIDTIGTARIGKIEKNGSCTSGLEFQGSNFKYMVKYSLEGTEAIAKKSPTGTETSKGCGRIN